MHIRNGLTLIELWVVIAIIALLTLGIAARHQSRTAGCAHSSADIEISESHTLYGHVVEVGHFEFGCSEATDICKAMIIGED